MQQAFVAPDADDPHPQGISPLHNEQWRMNEFALEHLINEPRTNLRHTLFPVAGLHRLQVRQSRYNRAKAVFITNGVFSLPPAGMLTRLAAMPAFLLPRARILVVTSSLRSALRSRRQRRTIPRRYRSDAGGETSGSGPLTVRRYFFQRVASQPGDWHFHWPAIQRRL